jgi:DNA topoisomerase VI subunit B
MKKTEQQLNRTVFSTSREMDYFSVKELVTQTGHPKEKWPLVILKELIDNSLDACEDARTPPIIDIVVNENGISITDNGPGLDENTIRHMLNFQIRVSSREAYVAPDRGAQGNGFKTVLAVPLILNDGRQGQVEIISKGLRHIIVLSVDTIDQKPIISRKTEPFVKNGTSVKICWPNIASTILIAAKSHFLQIAENYVFMNPHLTLSLNWFGEPKNITAMKNNWPKWTPSNPLSPHWYDIQYLSHLIERYISHDRKHGKDRTIRKFIAEFRGLSSTLKQKRVLRKAGLERMNLSALVDKNRIDANKIHTLLSAMQNNSKPVTPNNLGVIGQNHLEYHFAELGCEMDSFQYKKESGMDNDGLPYVLEIAFAWCEKLCNQSRIITGVNFAPGIIDLFRQIDDYDYGLSDFLYKYKVECYDPVIFFMHLTSPRISFTDRGKTAVVMRIPRDTIESSIKLVTKKWTKQKKSEQRNSSANRRQAMKQRSAKISKKDAAYDVMESAYLKASDNDTLPATARQIMYAARPEILRITGAEKLGSTYFRGILLSYLREHPELTWDVVFDARGHFAEPHNNIEFGIGTLGVRNYLQNISNHTVQDIQPIIKNRLYPTAGPKNRYSAILFVEKEGFMPLFQKVQLAERYDLAIMSTKGMSVAAARQLVDTLCSNNDDSSIPLLVLHDFDIAGFSILGTLQRDTERYKFLNKVRVIDLGIRLEDIEKYNLDSEDCSLNKKDPTSNLRLNGATEKEIAYLCQKDTTRYEIKYSGKRVELNSFSSGEFITWIESKLEEHGIRKVIPDNKTLKTAYQRVAFTKILHRKLEQFADKVKCDVAKLNPQMLSQKVEELIKQNPSMPWDLAVSEIVRDDL